MSQSSVCDLSESPLELVLYDNDQEGFNGMSNKLKG